MRYTFGTNEIALERLGKISAVFNPHSQSFIREHIRNAVGSALDLGCGPCFTTQMLSMVVPSKEVYGIDISEEFLSKAMGLFDDCVFIKHDLTNTPFPVFADVMYSRFVLAHLDNPVTLVNRWADELSFDGTLFIEEVEDIETKIDVFNRYLSVNRGLVASQGAELYAGKKLSKGKYHAKVLSNKCIALPVKNCDAAAMFYPNTVSIWEKEEYVLDTISHKERKEISSLLFEMMNSRDESTGIVWGIRRIALKNNRHDQYLEMFI